MDRRNPPKPKPKKTIDEEAKEIADRRKHREKVNARLKKSIDEEAQDQVNRKKHRDQVNAKAKLLTPPAPPKPPPNPVADAHKKLDAMDHRQRVKEEMEAIRPTQPKPVKTFADEVNQAVASERKRLALQKAVDAKMGRNGFGARMATGAAQATQAGAGGLSGMMAGLGRLGPIGMAAAAALMAFQAGLHKATEIVNIENDGTKTRAQKDRGIVEAVVPFAESIRKLREAIDGTTETLAKNKRRLDYQKVSIEAGATYERKLFDFQAESNMAGARLRAHAEPGAAPGAMDRFDRGTAIGARKAAEQDIMMPAYDAARRANIEARAQRSQANLMAGLARGAGGESKKLKADADNKFARARELREGERTGPRNKAAIDTAYTDALIAQDRYLKAQAREEDLIRRAKEAGLSATQAESAARKANIDVQRAELEVLKQREERMTGLAGKLGSMGIGDFEMAKAMLQTVRETGVENLPPEMVDMAAQVAPEFIAKQREKLGEQRAKEVAGENRGIDDSILAEFEKSTLGEVRAKVDQVKADVRVMIDLDAQELAKAVVDTLNPLFRQFFDSIRGEFNTTIRQFEAEREQGYNAAG
jgi:hypothetical protein